MPLKTTVIGSYPKPDYITFPDWFKFGAANSNLTELIEEYNSKLTDKDREYNELMFRRGTCEVIDAQVTAGIDCVTDGEVRRENYVHYLCRDIDGIDFNTLTSRVLRNGAYTADCPTITGPLVARMNPNFLDEWKYSQSVSSVPVKYTLPGPMTIMGTLYDGYYKDPRVAGATLAAIVNGYVMALVEAGCTVIQIDEPLFARHPEAALEYGFEHLERCFQGVPPGVLKCVHACCGYPDHLDQEGYLKADLDAYLKIAAGIDASPSIDAISLEDAHRHNDLSALLPHFTRTNIILGCVAIAKSRVESVEEISARLEAALQHIPAERLIVAPDCGLAFLPAPILAAKLQNMVTAARLAAPGFTPVADPLPTKVPVAAAAEAKAAAPVDVKQPEPAA